jgi:hypothetical protein
VKKLRYILIVFILAAIGTEMFGQEENVDFDNLLLKIDTIENPVFLPLVSIGFGPLYFMGDVDNSSRMPLIGNSAVKANVTTYLDNKHYIAVNFSYMSGTLYGEQRSAVNPLLNQNFKSGVTSFGASARYEFGHFLSEELKIRPYVSLGFEQLAFSERGVDLINDLTGEAYHYWTDGTIRNISEGEPGAALQLHRDYAPDEDLPNISTFGIPVEIGFTLKVANRMFFSVGTEYHYTFSDNIDNVAFEGTSVIGDKAKDAFLFTSASLKFDLFSDPTTRTYDLLFANYDMDLMFFDDEDGDMILDNADHCLETPYGVVTDTLGCPLDIDEDGVPDYLDKEVNTPKGTWVDNEGVTLLEGDFHLRLQRDLALSREDLDLYLKLIEDRFIEKRVEEIPEKFAILDSDGDGYISFDELLKVIDSYFDFKINLSLDELRQVNEFFFSQ